MAEAVAAVAVVFAPPTGAAAGGGPVLGIALEEAMAALCVGGKYCLSVGFAVFWCKANLIKDSRVDEFNQRYACLVLVELGAGLLRSDAAFVAEAVAAVAVVFAPPTGAAAGGGPVLGIALEEAMAALCVGGKYCLSVGFAVFWCKANLIKDSRVDEFNQRYACLVLVELGAGLLGSRWYRSPPWHGNAVKNERGASKPGSLCSSRVFGLSSQPSKTSNFETPPRTCTSQSKSRGARVLCCQGNRPNLSGDCIFIPASRRLT